MAVINKVELMLHELKSKDITVCAIITDNASAYTAARYFAHQINLCVGKIFKKCTEFKITIDHAIRLATYFKNSNHKFFIAKLWDQQYETYRKYIAIAVPREIGWNSLYYICSITNTCPNYRILTSLRRTSNFVIMNYLVQFWLNYSDEELATQLILQLEKHWKDWEQPILMLSYLLHPKYQMNQFNNASSSINYLEFGKWLMYYYRAWSGKELKYILCEFDDFWLLIMILINNLIKIFGVISVINLNELENNNNNGLVINLEKEIKLEDLDDKGDRSDDESEGEFNFQDWVKMLESEKNSEFDEEFDESSDTLNNITHPANDSNAKWKLLILFKVNTSIDLPF
ncbi:hypothetical protein C1645_824083 [Glomus cerebriforme]|uniref:DUF659 domain-containing protein n=1 Tax=Glomus cerebriforme TaxID=658196 RepID=A0A397T1K1_9GLOM|nr:hypothetical protein C1645_824083 [Glomus cerebriforme]